MPAPLELVATCALGLERIVASELAELGVADPRVHRGAVVFGGDWPTVWRANWRLRAANRVLVVLATWSAADGDALAAGAERLIGDGERSWDGVEAHALFAPQRTFALRATTGGSPMRDVRWIALRVKDGLVDAQRRRFGRRASVDRRDPELALRVRLQGERATLLLDTSGEPLDRRGYRLQTAAAPLRENLAAACVLASGWDGRGPVVDPMCGTGTLLAEAGLIARGVAPGALRPAWAFERLPGYDARRFAAIRSEPLPAPAPEVALVGVDRDAAALAAARANLERAGLADFVTLRRGDAFELEPPPGPGLLVVNPPHGERLATSREAWRRLGDLLKRRYTGWRAVVLAGGGDLGKHIGLRPSFRLPVRNGPLEAKVLGFELY